MSVFVFCVLVFCVGVLVLVGVYVGVCVCRWFVSWCSCFVCVGVVFCVFVL